MRARVAVASKDGRPVRQSFSHAEEFTVYELQGGRLARVAVRQARRAEGPGSRLSHLAEAISLVADCRAVVAGGMEFGARVLLAQRGIRPYEDPYLSEETLYRVTASWAQEWPVGEALAA